MRWRWLCCISEAMAIIFERIQTEGIAELSYLVGDDSVGSVAIIDPRRDVEVYLKLARDHGVSITHIFETHIHADLVSGARELAAQTGTAKIYASIEEGAEYGFEIVGVQDGDRYEIGSLSLTARHTPGHTPEHISYEIAEAEKDVPYGVFTGDSLFVNSAGRPDLLGDNAEELASDLYDTLFDYFAKLAPGVIIYPSHGAGSPCGADIGDRLESTIGYELEHNAYFRKTDRAELIDHALSTAPPEPTYYQRMKKVNSEGPEILSGLPLIPALTPDDFVKHVDEGKSVLIDTRNTLAFGGGHIEGAMNIQSSPMLTVWAGWLLDPDKPILLVLESDNDVEKIASFFVRSGYTKFTGYLAGGMAAWDQGGNRLSEVPQMTVHEVNQCSEGLQILDVRSPSEWENGRIPGASHLFLPEIPDGTGDLKKTEPIVTYCASGYRAGIAASLLKQQGFEDVRTLPGSWKAWKAQAYPIEKGDSKNS